MADIAGYAIAVDDAQGVTHLWHRLAIDLRQTLWTTYAEAEKQIEYRRRDGLMVARYRNLRVVSVSIGVDVAMADVQQEVEL